MAWKQMLRAMALLTGFAVIAGTTAARSDLREEPQIREGLIVAGIAYEIGRVCDGVDVRLLRGIGFLQSIENTARSMGYSQDEIDAYVDNATEKARLEAMARQRLRDMGAVEGDADSYCSVGRSEIARGSQIGRLLR